MPTPTPSDVHVWIDNFYQTPQRLDNQCCQGFYHRCQRFWGHFFIPINVFNSSHESCSTRKGHFALTFDEIDRFLRCAVFIFYQIASHHCWRSLHSHSTMNDYFPPFFQAFMNFTQHVGLLQKCIQVQCLGSVIVYRDPNPFFALGREWKFGLNSHIYDHSEFVPVQFRIFIVSNEEAWYDLIVVSYHVRCIKSSNGIS